jgi:alkyl hydroperoxide reductase subunit AhpF
VDATIVERTACITNLQTYIGYKAVQFVGDGTLTGLTIRKMAGAETLDLPAKGVFIAVGLEPNSSLAAPLLKLNPPGEIIISPDCSTSYPEILPPGT